MNDVSALGKILGLWAHPDDETFSSAGLMSEAVKNGQDVCCVTATYGEAGVRDDTRWPANQLAAIRKAELEKALQIIGVSEHYWLELKDGQCQSANEAAVLSRLQAIVQEFQPDTIITFPPNGLTGHPDHQAVSQWARKVASLSPKPVMVLQTVVTEESYATHFQKIDEALNIFYNLEKPQLFPESACALVLHMTSEECRQKCDALKAMPSQMSVMTEMFSEDYLCEAFGVEAFIQG